MDPIEVSFADEMKEEHVSRDRRIPVNKYDRASSGGGLDDAIYGEGATPLFRAIEEVNWREALRKIDDNPEQVRRWVKSTGGENIAYDWSLWRRLPIHEACRRQAPAWLISALLSVYPESAKCMTHFGELPLHLAVGCAAPPEVVNLIVVANWEAIAVRDKSGRTPLEVWNDSELHADLDQKIIYESLLRCHHTYTRLQSEWQGQIESLKKSHEATIMVLYQKHEDAIRMEAEKQNKLELELHKLYDSLELLTGEAAEKDNEIKTFVKVERTWLERVDTLTKHVERLRVDEAKEKENSETLRQLVDAKDEQIRVLSKKVTDLSNDMQKVMSWYDKTEQGLGKTQRNLQKMVDNYVEVHGKLIEERGKMKEILSLRGIELPHQKLTAPPPPPPPLQQTTEEPGMAQAYQMQDPDMQDAANAAAAAANAAIAALIADPD